MKIVILGDIGASESNVQAFCDADKDLFSTEIQEKCAEADLVLMNLEKPLTDVITPLGKCPPDYAAPTKTINGIKLLHPTVVTLANNHIMDQQVQGLESTMRVLKDNEIKYVGVGRNLKEARKPIIISEYEKRIGIYACCEKEFSFATEISAGANVYDPLETFDDIQDLKQECDYLIVLFHGGMQGYPYPTPNQQKICRKMCDKGANLVICQHSHIIGCEERTPEGIIVYGQGNFLLDDLAEESWQTGLMIEVELDNDGKSVQYFPTQMINHKVVCCQHPEMIKKKFIDRSKEILTDKAIVTFFSEYSNKKISNYLIKLSGKGEFTQKIARRLGVTKHYHKKYSKDVCNMMLDYFYCDSHREAIEYGLNEIVMKKNKQN